MISSYEFQRIFRLDFLAHFSETSPYQTNEFNEGGHRLFPIRRQSDQKPLSPREYVAVIGDVLRMKKNICLARHFHRMDKNLVHRSNHIKYIDVSFIYGGEFAIFDQFMIFFRCGRSTFLILRMIIHSMLSRCL